MLKKMINGFAKQNSEQKAAILVMIGFFGALLSGMAGDLWVHSIVYDVLVTGVLSVILVVGCFKMIVVMCKKTEDWLAKLMGTAAFGLVGLMTTEILVDWVAQHVFSVELPQITAWYALPLMAIFLFGLIVLVFRGIGDARQRRRNS